MLSASSALIFTSAAYLALATGSLPCISLVGPAAVSAAAKAGIVPKAQKGIVIEDEMGQYNHPGKITKIPSGDIMRCTICRPLGTSFNERSCDTQNLATSPRVAHLHRIRVVPFCIVD
jgi:hypothetical protein